MGPLENSSKYLRYFSEIWRVLAVGCLFLSSVCPQRYAQKEYARSFRRKLSFCRTNRIICAIMHTYNMTWSPLVCLFAFLTTLLCVTDRRKPIINALFDPTRSQIGRFRLYETRAPDSNSIPNHGSLHILHRNPVNNYFTQWALYCVAV